jgi:hypothetical protein
VSASTTIANTEDLQATVYQSNHIGTSFSYTFGPADALLPGQTYTVSLPTPQRILHNRSLQRSGWV